MAPVAVGRPGEAVWHVLKEQVLHAAPVDQTVRVVDPPFGGSEVELGSIGQRGHTLCLLVGLSLHTPSVCPSDNEVKANFRGPR